VNGWQPVRVGPPKVECMLFYRVVAGCQIQPATVWHIQSRAPLTSTSVWCYNGGQTNTRETPPSALGRPEGRECAFLHFHGGTMPRYETPVPTVRHFRLTEDLDRDVDTLAREDGVTRSHVIRDALIDYRSKRAAQRQDRRDTAA